MQNATRNSAAHAAGLELLADIHTPDDEHFDPIASGGILEA